MKMRKFTYVLLLLLLTFQVAVTQQPGEISFHDESVMPAGIKGEQIEAVITTVNANDPDHVREFMEKHCTKRFQNFAPMDQHIDVFLNLFQETGGVDFHSIRTYVPERKGETVVILKDRNFGSWRAFVLSLDEKNDSLISGLNFAIARTPSNVKEPTLNEEQFLQNIKDMMEELIKKNVFSGTLLIAKGDKILMTSVGGEASKRF
ncbi:MAG: hypothetical protein V3S65_02860, partial [Candidatus Aminicenantaceae bacterium]